MPKLRLGDVKGLKRPEVNMFLWSILLYFGRFSIFSMLLISLRILRVRLSIVFINLLASISDTSGDWNLEY